MCMFEKSLEVKTTDVMSKCEGLLELSFKASGCSVMDFLSEINSETGSLIIGCMDLYRSSKDLAIAQAKAIDTLIENFEELKKANEKLCKQNEYMQQLLHDLNREVKKDRK